MKKTVCLFVSTIILIQAFAKVQLASLFQDHAVLQQQALVPIWGTADANEKVTVMFGKQTKTTVTNNDGKWMVYLDKLTAGGPFILKVKASNEIILNDVYVGEVWLCSGQSNMDMTVAKEDRYWCGVNNEAAEVDKSNYPLIRVFDVDYAPRDIVQSNAGGLWEICSPKTVGHFSAAAYFFARELFIKYKVPIGLITTAYGASTAEAWTSQKELERHPQFFKLLNNYSRRKKIYDTSFGIQKKYVEQYAKWQRDSIEAKAAKKPLPKSPNNPDPKVDQHMPYVLYNGMVAPLVPYAIKGAIWYQGESNTPTKEMYADIMESLIKNWRADFKQGDFPFIYVQLANYGKSVDSIAGKGGSTTFIREQQLKNLSITNTAMVVAIDNADDAANIHPKNKQAIGHRLALAAEAKVYGESIAYSGPLFMEQKVEGNRIRIFFKHVNGGLVAKNNELKGFAIAGSNKKFVWANAMIDGETIILSHPSITEPVAARYAWGDNPIISLYNKENLPASPFRTDNF